MTTVRFLRGPKGRATRRCAACGLWLAAAAMGAGDGSVAPRDYRATVWGPKDGLPDSTVNAVLQTRDGCIWIGTERGLARFDGARFLVFDTWNTKELHSDRVSALCEDRQGTLWIGSKGGGVTRYREGRFAHAGLSSQTITALCTDKDGGIWVGTVGGGLFNAAPAPGTGFASCGAAPDPFVLALSERRQGGVWLGTRDAGLVALANTAGLVRTDDTPVPGSPVQALAEDARGTLWVGSARGVAWFRGSEQGTLTVRDGLPDDSVQAIAAGPAGDVWIGTRAGLARLAAGATAARRWAGSEPVSCCCVDREGNVWIGTAGAGLLQLAPTRFAVLAASDGLAHDVVSCVFEDRENRLWIGTYGGLDCLAKGALRRFGTADGLPSPIVTALAEDAAGVLWVGTEQGPSRIEQGRLRPCGAEDGWPQCGTWAFCLDRTGTLWMGTAEGLYEVAGGRATRRTVADGLPANDVRALAEGPEGRLWVGTSHGVAYRSGNAFLALPLPPELLTRIILCLRADRDGTLWCGTLGGGLIRCRGGQARAYTTREGLPDNTLYSILEDAGDCLWLSSNRGVFRVSKSALDGVAAGTADTVACVMFGRTDGLPAEECRGFSQPAGLRSRDGCLWFPTGKGLAVLDPARLAPPAAPPPVVLERVVVDNQAFERPERVAAGPGASAFEFHFAGLSFAMPERVRFRYRLEGLDRDWIDAGNRRTAYYTRIPPGTYRFRVTACNSDGVWNADGAAIGLSVVPHVWQTGWFLALMALVVVGTVAGGARYAAARRWRRELERLERQRAVEHERARIAQDIHDEVGASLTRIARLTAAVERQTDSGHSSKPLLGTIAATTHGMVQAMDEIVWAVNPGNDSLDATANYLVHYGEEFLRPAGVACRLDVPMSFPAVALSADVRHNLFMAAKEALNNAVRHGAPRGVTLSLGYERGVLALGVADDGRGFDPAAGAACGNGLANMRSRLAAIGGELDVRSAPGQGTTVTMRVTVAAARQPRPPQPHLP